MRTTKLRILHISDLHARGSREADPHARRRVLGPAWERNLEELGEIDLVCFTGDIAFSGQPDQYRWASEYLQTLLDALKLPRERLFVVPGNHDIDREVEKTGWKRFRKSLHKLSPDELASWMAGGKPPTGFKREQRELLLSRQRAYRNWLEAFGRKDLLPASPLHPHLGYRRTLRLPRLHFDIHIIGLDSAWASGDDNDALRLFLTDAQVNRLTSDTDGGPLSGFRLALVHHPLSELAHDDQARCRTRGERGSPPARARSPREDRPPR